MHIKINSWIGSCALSGKMLLLRIIEENKTDDILSKVRLSKGLLCPIGLGKRFV